MELLKFTKLNEYIEFDPSIKPRLGSNECYHLIYCIINKVNQKFYIGKHSTNNLNDGYMGSSRHLWNSMEKYGYDNFEKYIISYHESSDEAYHTESLIVTQELVDSPYCYNHNLGGKGRHWGYGESNPMYKKSLEGTHHWIGDNNPSIIRVKNGTHNLLGDRHWNKLAIANGTHPLQNRKPWNNNCTKASKLSWWLSDISYKLYTDNITANELYRECIKESGCLDKFNYHPSAFSFRAIVYYFRYNEWNPNLDDEWLEFKEHYNPLLSEIVL